MIKKMELKTTVKVLVFAGAVGGMVSKELFENEVYKIKQPDVPQEHYSVFIMMTPSQTSTSAGMANFNSGVSAYRL